MRAGRNPPLHPRERRKAAAGNLLRGLLAAPSGTAIMLQVTELSSGTQIVNAIAELSPGRPTAPS